MEDYIQISKLNDFIFCPRSLYFHAVYDGFHKKTYQGTPQTVGTLKHEKVDTGKYSSAKRFVQGLEVFSEELGIAGKIDMYDAKEKILIERKTKVKKIYDGYRKQLYAQYYCLKEMGYDIRALRIHSLDDNKRYPISLPNLADRKELELEIDAIRKIDIAKSKITASPEKCANCIYRELCH